jgi:hypothetical protein
MMIYRAQSGAVSVKFKLKTNELFTRYRTDDKSTVTVFSYDMASHGRLWRATHAQAKMA